MHPDDTGMWRRSLCQWMPHAFSLDKGRDSNYFVIRKIFIGMSGVVVTHL